MFVGSHLFDLLGERSLQDGELPLQLVSFDGGITFVAEDRPLARDFVF